MIDENDAIKRALKILTRSPNARIWLYRISRYLCPAVNPQLFWASLPLVINTLGKFNTPKKPTIVLMAMPRSGSSWIGDILGSSKESLFLKEPLTQTYIPIIGNGPSFFQFEKCKEKKIYEQSAHDAFKGIPRFHRSIVPYPNQWSYFRRGEKRIVIKEVNPLFLNWIIERYHPRIVYLLRHPVPVANSFFVRGWTGEQFRNRFCKNKLTRLKKRFSIPINADFWEQSGALQAIIQNLTMEILQSVKDKIVIHYEDVCGAPYKMFKEIFNFCDMKYTDEIQKKIEDSTISKSTYIPGRYDTKRNSMTMPKIWRAELKKEVIDSVRKGYLTNQPIFYKGDENW